MQIQPRAAWSTMAAVLGADPVTLSRRWTRLEEQGVAWIAVYRFDAAVSSALVEVECPPAETMRIAEVLSADPEILTIDVTTGGRDLLLTLACERRDGLSRYVVERMGALSEIRALRTHIVADALSDARRWRLRELDADEAAALEPPAAPARVSPVAPELADRIRGLLMKNPRMTIAALATEAGIPAARASASLAALLASGEIVLRTEIARPLSGWPVCAWYFLRADPRQRTAAMRRLARLGETRFVAPVVGGYDIVLVVWLRSVDDVARIETYFTEHVPGIAVADRSVVLRTPYHLRKPLDRDGRFRGPATGR